MKFFKIFVVLAALTLIMTTTESSLADALTRARIEAQLNKESGEFFRAIKSNYPREYERMLAQITRAAKGRGSPASKEKKVASISRKTVVKIRKRGGRKARVMPDAHRKRVINATVKLIKLGKNRGTATCLRVIDVGGDALTNRSKAENKVLFSSGAAVIKAVAASERAPTRQVGTATTDDYVALVQQSGMSEEDFNIISKIRSKNPKRCNLTVRFLEQITKLKGPAGERVRAETVKDLLKG